MHATKQLAHRVRRFLVTAMLVSAACSALPISPSRADAPPAPQPGQLAPRDPEPLVPGKPIEKALSIGTTHSYSIELAADRSVQVVIEKDGVPAVVSLFAPGGKRLGIFGSSTSSQGTETVTFVTESSGSYRIELRTLFKPAPPARYRITLAGVRASSDQDRIRESRPSCAQKSWLDSDNHFLVDTALGALSQCLGAVGRRLGPQHPEAPPLVQEAQAQIGYLSGRWRWGEFVSQAYQDSLLDDFTALGESLEQPDQTAALALLKDVVEDIKVKTAHCKKSNRGLGGDVKIKVLTRRGGTEVRDMFVFYKRCLYRYSKSNPNRFGKASPVSGTLPPSVYLLWAGQEQQAPAVTGELACIPVQGSEEQQIDLLVP